MKIKNGEISQLSGEITSLAEVLKENKLFTPKYYLSNLSSSLTETFKNFEETRVDIIKKYAEEKDGTFSVSQFEDDDKTVETQNYKDFIKELTEFMDLEVSVDVKAIPLSVFEKLDADPKLDVKFDYYPTLYKFIKP